MAGRIEPIDLCDELGDDQIHNLLDRDKFVNWTVQVQLQLHAQLYCHMHFRARSVYIYQYV